MASSIIDNRLVRSSLRIGNNDRTNERNIWRNPFRRGPGFVSTKTDSFPRIYVRRQIKGRPFFLSFLPPLSASCIVPLPCTRLRITRSSGFHGRYFVLMTRHNRRKSFTNRCSLYHPFHSCLKREREKKTARFFRRS